MDVIKVLENRINRLDQRIDECGKDNDEIYRLTHLLAHCIELHQRIVGNI